MHLLSSDGKNIGVVSIKVALNRAKESELDLVEIVSQANPPVCKLLDYKRYYYDKKRKSKENKRKSKSAQLKQIRVSPNIGRHDLEVKSKHIKEFLNDGHKVKVNMMFKGRQKEHLDIGREILNAMIAEFKGIGIVQSEPVFEGFYMTMLLVPDKEKGIHGA